RIVRIRVRVRDGRQVHVHARDRQLGPDRSGHAVGQPDVVDRSERQVAGERRATVGLEPSHVAALLVDRDQHIAQLAAEIRQPVTVCLDWSLSSTRAKMYSFQDVMNAKTEVATSPGAISGSRIRTKAPRRVDPSTIAASSSSFGIPMMNPRSVQTENGSTNVM